nr:DUF805 domain-containing protein [Brevundimonas subvibrioides]
MARLPYFLSVLGLWLILLLAQPLLLDLPNFIESGRILDLLWDGDYEAFGMAADAAIHKADYQTARYAALAALALALFAAFLMLSARRLRDLGRPGRYALIALIPFVGAPALFAVLILLPGDAGENAYGPGHQAHADQEAEHGFRPVRGA